MDPWSLLTVIGYSFCHQLPERSYLLGDLQMPLCARCIGIHLGFLLSSMLMWVGVRRFASGMENKKILIVLAAIVLSGFGLAILAYAGLGFDDNTSRTISGFMIGTPIPFVVVPVLNMIMFPGRNLRMPLTVPAEWAMLAAVFAIGAAATLLATSSEILFYAVSIFGIVGLLVFVFTFMTILVAVLTDEKAWPIRNKLIASVAASIILLIVLNASHASLLF